MMVLARSMFATIGSPAPILSIHDTWMKHVGTMVLIGGGPMPFRLGQPTLSSVRLKPSTVGLMRLRSPD